MKCLCFIVLLAIVIAQSYVGVEAAPSDGFVSRNGVQFILNGKPFYANGFNAYWLAYEATDPATRFKITNVFQNATSLAEAKRVGIKLIIPLVNNWDDYGGKKQYVDWARSKGEMVSSNDDFYRNPVIKEFYKNHVKTMLNRVNTFTKVAYKDEPASMAWQLMNEPRCGVDRSGKTLMAWINEMALFVKSVDPNHLLSTGHEGFYGDSSPERKNSLNPVSANTVGADFIANHNIDAIDFASMHCGSDLWFQRLDQNSRLAFIKRWLEGHIEDAQNNLKKPVILAEFGLGSDTPRYTLANRDDVFTTTYDIIYDIYAKRRLGRGSIVLGGY
ncbi:Glycosyl hydrolase superfamily protein [Arabidopsis thaliana]|uniref:Glycosyl hydrolase superfamily protein n=1 Tax=Arabidopsis thaliana TaxID=3702 RepID=UPI0001E92DAD|nr:Glycosyl hydrolase superfamily protein [Arabidopsis thaliana]AEE77650.1 Glycosyl hydrolase superfamily protein [Arabidopsis thaliana]|eukprot:NP_189675.2 Glycosyl hydrolase superfamily protein [Arabidopsis thaliana]